ncbi:hypothetical protein [Pleionea sp. CnH1-48]|uniref:hypothetical protein n=1 Tax=Pleionea sp. CnH1-48 TaxID=2954494 RepID=UPI002097F78E|nr:hypothetical protein [Pleionea sp. CnH1-48]MCO7227502.1 hypothetical protein [Pleionea sp. CnH1-48]
MNLRTLRSAVALLVFGLSNAVFAADFSVPSLSRCLDDMKASNTQDAKVYNLYTDFYYEMEDKRDYAVEAVNQMAKLFAPENSECRQFSQPMNRETVTCEKIGGSDVCIIPSDAGEFVVVKDYVDSTNIVLTEYDNDYRRFPRIKAANDQASLWLPKPELCYSDLLANIFDSQSYMLDASSYTNFGDFRYVLARTTRDLVKSIETDTNECRYETSAHEAGKTQCLYRRNKPSICGITTTGGGYFIYVTDADKSVHLIFNRWD